MIEDRILGLKARENYEHPAATVILLAHRDLEGLVLTRQELAFKRMVDDKWSELAYKGLVYEPLYAALNAFIDTTQERVNGKVDLELYKGSVRVLGRSSPDAIYSRIWSHLTVHRLTSATLLGSPSILGYRHVWSGQRHYKKHKIRRNNHHQLFFPASVSHNKIENYKDWQ